MPHLVASAGPDAVRRYLEFFGATIRNRNTRMAYGSACARFLDWCDQRGVRALATIEPLHVAAYIEARPSSVATVKQHLAAIRMLGNWLVMTGVLRSNPAQVVKGPSHVVSRGKTPVLSAEQARHLLDAIPLVSANGIPSIAGLRDRALIAVMVFTFARVSAVTTLRVGDYFQEGKRWAFRLQEKGGKQHVVPAHHTAEEYVDAYLAEAGIGEQLRGPLFRSLAPRGDLSLNAMGRTDVLNMVKRRAVAAGLPSSTSCHTFRATGITAYMDNGGTLENAQAIAAHASPRTTKLYDRSNDAITLDEVERIRI